MQKPAGPDAARRFCIPGMEYVLHFRLNVIYLGGNMGDELVNIH